jgi:hypothetical protein
MVVLMPVDTQIFWAGLLFTSPLGVVLPSVVRVTEPSPARGIFDVAEITLVPVTAEVMTTVQLAVRPPPV